MDFRHMQDGYIIIIKKKNLKRMEDKLGRE